MVKIVIVRGIAQKGRNWRKCTDNLLKVEKVKNVGVNFNNV